MSDLRDVSLWASDAVLSVESLAEFVEKLADDAASAEAATEAGTEPFATQHFLIAIQSLQSAASHLHLAEMHLVRNRRIR